MSYYDTGYYDIDISNKLLSSEGHKMIQREVGQLPCIIIITAVGRRASPVSGDNTYKVVWRRYLGEVGKFNRTVWLIYPRHCTPISIKIGQHLLKLCTKVF